MQEKKFWYLLSVRLTGEATSEELDALDHLLQEHPELGLKAQLMVQLWKNNNSPDNAATADFFDRHLQRMGSQPGLFPLPEQNLNSSATYEEPPARSNRLYWILPISAVAAAVLLFFYVRTPSPVITKERPAQNTVSTRKGSKSTVQLPDGSTAWLNADSKLTYDENFRGEIREVFLEGEVFFDVVKDKSRPFIIHTKTLDIKVLGTAFNVRAYETEKNTETALFRGSVEVTLHNNPYKKIVMKPNEKLMVNNKSLSLTTNAAERKDKRGLREATIRMGKVHFTEKDSVALETLWIKNKLVLDAETLEEVAQKIERWYDVKVIVRGDNALKKTAYSAIFENENLEEVMEALKITGNFKYSISKDTITIK